MGIFLKNLRKKFGKRELLNIPEFKFEKGKIYSIIGSNGIGKSTLLKLIYGLIEPCSGAIERGENMITYNPQEEIFLKGDVLYNLEEPFKLRGIEIPKDKMEKLLKNLQIERLKNSNVKNLSGGEKAKIQLIRTLLYDEDFILMDEPTASMDKKSTQTVEELILEAKERGKGIIIITHDFLQSKRISDYIYEIENGELKRVV